MGITPEQASALIRNSSIIIGLLGGVIAMLVALAILTLVRGGGKKRSEDGQVSKSAPGGFSVPFTAKGQKYSTLYDQGD